MKHSQNEEGIRQQLDALTDLTHICKNNNAPVKAESKPAFAVRVIRRIRRGDIRTMHRYGLQVLKGRLLNARGSKRRAPRTAPRQYDYFSDERIAVYTALFGAYDSLREPVCHPDNVDYYILTDQELPAESCWNPLDIRECIPEQYRRDSVMANRWCKMHPHLLFPEYNYSVYVDSNFLITSDLTALVNQMNDYPVAMFHHKERNCVYDEITTCIEKKKDSKDRLLAHKKVLQKKRIPKQFGLLEAPIIVRRHHEKRSIQLMNEWWRAFCRGCRRDQIALIEALWDLNIPPGTIAVLGDDFRECDLLMIFPHN